MKEYEKEALDPGVLTILIFGAEWCGPCRVVKTIMEDLEAEYKDKPLIMFHVDVDAHKKFTAESSVRTIPVMVFMKGGIVVDRLSGVATKGVFQNMIEKNLL